MGMTTRDIQIGLIAAMVESNLVNVNYGDRDSLGLFQQRPSAGWGTPTQVMDPKYAAGKFFSALKGLGDRRWQMSMGQAAQAVQRSAYPDRYGQRIPEMRGLWPRIAKAAGSNPLDMDGQPYGAPDPLTGQQKPGQDSVPPTMDAPDVGEMLGAWDVPDFEKLQKQYDAEHNPSGLLINEGTNSIIRQMAQTQGSFSQGVDGWRKAVVQFAKSYLGTPYVWGGTSPSGFDCSGLIQYVFNKAGINLPRISYQQANSGKRTGINGLQIGDLVAWDNSSRNNGADHIALYIGNGQIIEAPRPGLSVRIRHLGSNEGAWGVHLNE